MQRVSVISSSVVSVGYDQAVQTLEVELESGDVYRYYDVSSDVYAAFMAAPSKGRFFSYQVRDRFENVRL